MPAPESFFRLAFDISGYASIVVGGDGRMLAVNDEACRILGYGSGDLVGRPVEVLLPDERRARHVEQRAAFDVAPATRPMGNNRNLYARHASGELVPVEIALTPVEFGGERYVVASLIDITARMAAERTLLDMSEQLRQANERLAALAMTDPLTGLQNRRGLERVLWAAHSESARGRGTAAAILVDCDDFKSINDRLGHVAGDMVLKAVAATIAEAVRPRDCVARVGGDEFLVLLTDTREAEALEVAQRIRRRLATLATPVDDGAVTITVSIGVAPVPPHLSSVQELLTRCQHLLKRSKQGGKNRVSTHSDSGDDGASARQLAGAGLAIAAQPIVSLATAQLEGYELLSRWPDSRVSMPAEVFAMAREADALTSLDLVCLRACADAAHAHAPGVDIHVNLRPTTLLDTPVEQLVEALGPTEDGPSFVVELSEQQFVGDPSCLRSVVDDLRAADVQIAIDDLGYGRSSLEALVVLEPEVVKIDRRCIHGVATNVGLRHALGRLVRIIDALGVPCVAEGVALAEDAKVLRDLGIPLAQGYLFGRPELLRVPISRVG